MNWVKKIFRNSKSTSDVKNSTSTIMLAVLPFRNQNHNKERDYFSDGIAEEIINSLSAISGLTIISRNSSKGFNKVQDLQEIVQKVTLSKVIQGTIDRSEGQLKLDVELVDFKNHDSIWAKTYSTEIAKTQDVLNDIIKNVLESLNVNVIESFKIQSLIEFEAFDGYLKEIGRAHV